MKYLQVRLDNDMHKKFKRKCLDKEVEMSDKVRKWIENFINKGE